MIYDLGKELVLPEIIRRYSQLTGLKVTVINEIRLFLGINEVLAHPNQRISAQNLVDASNVWKLLLVKNLTWLKGRS